MGATFRITMGSMTWKRGALNSDAVIVIGILFFIFYAWFAAGGPQKYERGESVIGSSTSTRTTRTTNTTQRTQTTIRSAASATQSATSSPYTGSVRITSRGNAPRERFAGNEYIIIQNVSKEAVTITNWSVANGRDVRGKIDHLNRVSPGVSDRAYIPSGVFTLLPTNPQTITPIVLLPREKAIITTGRMNKKASFLGNSFKVNKCSGYINEFTGYPLVPTLSNQCPSAKVEFGNDLLEDSCARFINRIRTCHEPVYREEILRTGERREYLDSTYGLSRQCRELIIPRLNYGRCVLAHKNDSDFYRAEWRIYLNRNFEMWVNERERIRLYDSSGLLVHEMSY